MTNIYNPFPTPNCSQMDESSSAATLCFMVQSMKRYQGILSLETRQIFELVLVVILSGSVSLFGVVSNILNMIIFYKQGLTTTTNISFLALAVSDLGSVVTIVWMAISLSPIFIGAVPQWDSYQVMHLTAGWPHLCFGHITCWITTYITAERCLCIALPLKVMQIVTPTRTICIICFLFLINFAMLIPVYESSYLDWITSPENNKTRILTMVVQDVRSGVEPAAFVMSAVLGVTCFPLVILFTVILVYKLRRQRTWRMKSSKAQKQTGEASRREVQTMKLVVLIAAVLIVCYTPGVLVSLLTSFVPGFNIAGVEIHLWFVSWAFVPLFEAVNSSMNIFLYYRMSSRYKLTFKELFSTKIELKD